MTIGEGIGEGQDPAPSSSHVSTRPVLLPCGPGMAPGGGQGGQGGQLPAVPVVGDQGIAGVGGNEPVGMGRGAGPANQGGQAIPVVGGQGAQGGGRGVPVPLGRSSRPVSRARAARFGLVVHPVAPSPPGAPPQQPFLRSSDL